MPSPRNPGRSRAQDRTEDRLGTNRSVDGDAPDRRGARVSTRGAARHAPKGEIQPPARKAPAKGAPRIRADGSEAVGRPSRPAGAPARSPRPAAVRSSAPANAPVRLKSERDDGLHRIAKLLARAGVASRRDIERMIEEGRIALNGQPVTKPATLLADLKGVTVDGKAVGATEATRLFLFHKPNGTLTAERDFSGRKTIYDVLPEGLPRLMPVGRLDLNTEGLLLLTNDGALKRKLELPATGIERTYRARTFGPITQQQLEDLAEGITIEGVRYGRIDANLERSTGRNQWIELTLTEGKNREVRRVLEYFGLQVSRLIRVRYGQFVLGSSAPGDVEESPPQEVVRLLNGLGMAD
ncbi:pseudouridine synthase [Sphingomonas lacunae]|uniref:pseudouridine synthase n=1 Tax=Sphingomonas lacunae TaxID=2698828 RepID=UPI001FEC74DB|nr:pseudouridine synthase [Sphingomonas lacunae]